MSPDGKVAGVEIRANGTKLSEEIGTTLTETRLQQNLRLPDACVFKFTDPGLKHVDSFPLAIGTKVELLLAGQDDTTLTSMFKGMIVSAEPDFSHGATLVFRAYDGSHLLHQSKNAATYQNMTASDIARKVGSRAGYDEGQIDSSPVTFDFVQQNNETDWEFLWKLAGRIDYEVLVLDHKLTFRKAGPPPGTQPIPLKWGETLLSFKPRVTAVQQVDSVTVRARDAAQANSFISNTQVSEPQSVIGISRAQAASALNGGEYVVADRPVLSQAEADALATSVANHVAAGYLEAEGVALGNVSMAAGSIVKVDGIGTTYGGTYVVSSVVHVFQSASGYKTHFTTSGRSARSLVDLATPKSKRGWGNSVVIGLVTNNNDPQKMGRVRVKYPALGEDLESTWARLLAPNAGTSRGLMMMPQVGDEVVIGFEHDDVHQPYILGSVWNGQSTPGDDLVQTSDGSFSLQSDQKIVMHSKDVITIKTDKDFTLETTGKIDLKSQDTTTIEPSQDLTVNGSQGITIKGGTTVSIEGTQSLEIKCGAAKISLDPLGSISISGSQISLGS
jgi:uncharacterized protein involved in type VI secretion and phage assembly